MHHEGGFRYAPARPPMFASRAMVASSQPTATIAGLGVFERGGNAVDAAIAAAAVLGVTEPMSTGVGGDVFAIVYRDGEVTGLDASGPAPVEIRAPDVVRASGPNSVTVPGAVAGWAMLAERFGRLGLDTCLQAAIDVAERGFAIGVHAARYWREADAVPARWMPAPAAGAVVQFPDQAATLRAIAQEGPAALYQGPVAARIAAASWLSASDLADYVPHWTAPLDYTFESVRVHELPPPLDGANGRDASLTRLRTHPVVHHLCGQRCGISELFHDPDEIPHGHELIGPHNVALNRVQEARGPGVGYHNHSLATKRLIKLRSARTPSTVASRIP